MTTRKPPEGLKDVSYIEQSGININASSKPKTVYKGSVIEACKLFPDNVNVAAALSLAGIGPQKTKVAIVPTLQSRGTPMKSELKGNSVSSQFAQITCHGRIIPKRVT